MLALFSLSVLLPSTLLGFVLALSNSLTLTFQDMDTKTEEEKEASLVR